MENNGKFTNKWGFIMACVGSAVGLANVWAFPYKLGMNGGLSFLIPYLFFVFIFGRVGLAAESAVGRKYKSGPMGVFKSVWKSRGNEKLGKIIRWIPLIGVFLLAIGYTVVITYVLKALIDSINGSLLSTDSNVWFESISTKDFVLLKEHLLLVIIVFLTLAYGTKGIEKTNSFMMPLFFILFIILAVRIAFLDKAFEGYKFIFSMDVSKLFDIKLWIAAMGQAFFSLSLVSTVMVVYGSYLPESEDIVHNSTITAVLDTIAAMLSSFVMLPATFAFGFSQSEGPKLIFVVLPKVLQNISGGRLFAVILYIAIVFAGVLSVQSMIETVAEAITSKFNNLNRNLVLVVLMAIVLMAGLFLHPIAKWGVWMNFVTIYILPISAIMGAISWFWVMKKEDLLDEINKGTKIKHKNAWYYLGRYLYVPMALILCIIAIRYQISF
ncbi:sodium-dependent transporter [Anaerococcus sp. AGMB00486]|uniref:Sodium-dependent transporter n=1 Tax=Anaerococcus faecalis TaxID=2742993 RepID=A0ABX2N8G6_9FIRM|nr:sodium-dependent transporter [Anaerococcus faecalis]NVF10991.1 sodium-dependent transporter [Anaerococcus faecalis]